MVKNYLVTAIRHIKQGTPYNKDIDAFEAYKKMYEMSIASYRNFVAEPFEEILFTHPSESVDSACTDNWYEIKNLWHKEPCNIFWAGADTIMVKPTSLFGDRFREFRMFNYTDPKEHKELPYYFNDDLRYMPHTMSEEIWQFGENLLQNRFDHPELQWGFDQVRHNLMFWKQDIPDGDRFHPELAYQCHNFREIEKNAIEWHDHWNNISISSAHILHFHASRGTRQVIEVMANICKQLDIHI